LQRAALHVVDLEAAEREHVEQVREATNMRWVAEEGGPRVAQTRVALYEARALFEDARARLDNTVAGRYRTSQVLEFRRASAADVVAKTPDALKEIREIQERLLRDPGWWFRDLTPRKDRIRIRMSDAANRLVAVRAVRLGRRLRSAAYRPWERFGDHGRRSRTS
jgi:hypothetical protein